MKKYMPVLYLMLFAFLTSFIIGFLVKKSWSSMNTILFVFGFIYLIFSFMYRNAKIKHYRKEQLNPYGDLEIENKSEFYHGNRILFLSSILTFALYFLFIYGFKIGI